jgi:hypothetical protein
MSGFGTKLPTSSGGSGTTAIDGATDTLVRQQMLGAVALRRRWGADGGLDRHHAALIVSLVSAGGEPSSAGSKVRMQSTALVACAALRIGTVVRAQ